MTPDVAIDIARDCFVIPKAAATLLVSCCDGSTPEIRARARQALRSLDRWAKVWIPEPGVLITRPGLVDPFDVGKVELAIAVCIGRMCRTADRVESNRLARLLTSVITESERIEHARRQRERAA